MSTPTEIESTISTMSISQRGDATALSARQLGANQTYSVGASSLGPQPVKNIKVTIDPKKIGKAKKPRKA